MERERENRLCEKSDYIQPDELLPWIVLSPRTIRFSQICYQNFGGGKKGNHDCSRTFLGRELLHLGNVHRKKQGKMAVTKARDSGLVPCFWRRTSRASVPMPCSRSRYMLHVASSGNLNHAAPNKSTESKGLMFGPALSLCENYFFSVILLLNNFYI